uniref:Uncharacterized protein n=1 Tax=Sinocyclocheilus grahami TaxID=75366 RepID=A0A672L6S6_SINGR
MRNPRRHLTSVDLLPTIPELQETQSLDDYIHSIRELSQPTYPLSGPLRGSHLSPLHLPWGPVSSNHDPLDWLFAQALTDPEDVFTMLSQHCWTESLQHTLQIHCQELRDLSSHEVSSNVNIT